jgi:iron complex transport system ATP-binding protein
MPARKSTPLVYARDVELRHEGRRIVEHIDWTVLPGENWAILGPNGCGKSTLSQCIQGRMQPWHGQMTVLGVEFGKAPIADLWKSVGFAGDSLEKLFLPHQTVEELVVSAPLGTVGLQFDRPTRNMKAAAQQLLEEWGLLGLAKRPWNRCSLGERRKTLIARALCASPRLLLLDEPFAGLDPAAREHLLDRLSQLPTTHPELSLVLVTHHLEEIPTTVSHALLMDPQGHATTGTKSEMLRSDRLSALYQRPFLVHKHKGRYSLLAD